MADESLQQPQEEATPKKRETNGYTALEIAEQIEFTAELISTGHQPWQIRKLLREKWGVKDRTAENRIRAARNQLAAENCGISRTEKVAEIISAMHITLQQALANGRGSDAIGSARLISELLQLNPKN